MDKEVLETVLKRSYKDLNIEHVIDMEIEPAIAKAENYQSTILRLKLKVVLGSGRVVKRSLIMKSANRGEGMDRIMRDFKPFKMENKMYTVIFKEMEYLMEEFGDHDGPLWCNFIHYDPSIPSLVLEDLKASGYSLLNRQSGLDLEHGMFVLRSLGRFHALAKILEERDVITKNDLNRAPLLSASYYIMSMTYAGLQCLRKAMKQHWGPKWANVAEKLNILPEVFLEKVLKCEKYKEDEFTCLNHGDCWSNNILFKHDWQNRPISLRFVDFQQSNYNSPCVDVTNFIYLSLQPKVRRENYKLLLDCYLDSLIKNLDRYGYTGLKPSMEMIELAMERLSFFVQSMFASFYPAIRSRSTETFDMEKLLKTGGKEGFSSEMYWEDGMIELIGEDLVDFVEKHLSS